PLSVAVSSDAENGAVVSVAIVTQLPLPAAARWKSTCAVSGSDDADSVAVPWRFVPGSPSVGAGDRLSTVTVRVVDVVELPAMSVTTTWICAEPSAPDVESQVKEYGGVVSVPTSVPRT